MILVLTCLTSHLKFKRTYARRTLILDLFLNIVYLLLMFEFSILAYIYIMLAIYVAYFFLPTFLYPHDVLSSATVDRHQLSLLGSLH